MHTVMEAGVQLIRLDGAIIALDTPKAYGGIRRMAYPSMSTAEEDAIRLAKAMTEKCRLAGLSAGGGKTVIYKENAGEQLYREVGRAIEALGGEYICGPDVGTGERELDWVRAETQWVNPRTNDPSRATARGVLAGIRACLSVLEGTERMDGMRFVVQGLGNVGRLVADAIAARGGRLRTVEIEDRLNPADIPCDVWVPCALGGILDEAGAEKVQARAICGPANNQLASSNTADILAERGVLWAPDVLVSAGAVIEGVMTTQGSPTREEIDAAIDAIGGRVEAWLARSRWTRRSRT